MKRFHVHVGVENIDASVKFYTALFAAEPTVVKSDYAKWMLDDPRVNFAISSSDHAARGIEHIGIQAETAIELAEVYGRLQNADRPVVEEGATTCCYAKSEKSWIADPDGVVWETFLTNGSATVYGEHAPIDTLESAHATAGNCCAPAIEAKPVVSVSSCC